VKCADYDAVVFDLDGTLVRLVVDWDAVAGAVAETFAEEGVDVSGQSLWTMLDTADERGLREAVEAVIVDHELAGAERSERLPAADRLVALDRPAGVCSLNGERPVRAALATHGLTAHVGAVVGRDSLSSRKPDPEPLLATVEALGATPGRALFVGDGDRDAEAAARAGVDFLHVEECSAGAD
jgi:phosphoglycolate phosphatase